MKLTTLPTLLLALIALAPATRAQDAVPETGEDLRRFTVEIIVFRYVEDVFSGSEVFPPDPPPPVEEPVAGDPAAVAELAIDPTELVPPDALDDADDANPAGEPDDTVEAREPSAGAVLLLRDEFSMLDFARRLERLDAYEPILHAGWTQPAPGQEESVPLDIAEFGPAPPGLEGQFTLYLGRFLHLVVDLALDRDPVADPVPENGAIAVDADEPLFSYGDGRPQYDADETEEPLPDRVRYRIQEDRIMKSGDVRYFDHPKFGVIAKVTRVEEPPADATPTTLPGVTR
jgi:hypothetical protein